MERLIVCFLLCFVMEKGFYHSKNIPLDRPMLILHNDPPAVMHALPRLRDIDRLINIEVAALSKSNQRDQLSQQNINKAANECLILKKQLEEQNREGVKRVKNFEAQLLAKDRSLMLVFCEV